VDVLPQLLSPVLVSREGGNEFAGTWGLILHLTARLVPVDTPRPTLLPETCLGPQDLVHHEFGDWSLQKFEGERLGEQPEIARQSEQLHAHLHSDKADREL
jgi:hypothetical protein